MRRPTKRLVAGLLLAFTAAGCAVPAKNMDRIQAGMNRDQVRAIMGPPAAVAYSAGKECAYYALLKDFWSRVPWSLSERYYVCYDEGKVETFGKVDVATSGL
jgi:SmpA/OmlA family protein